MNLAINVFGNLLVILNAVEVCVAHFTKSDPKPLQVVFCLESG